MSLKMYASLGTALLLLALLPSELSAFDKGYELLYTTNAGEVHDLAVTFDNPLPKWITGTLYKNGLGVFGMGPRNVTHFFDAFAKMHSWKLQGDSKTAHFTTAFVRSNLYNESIEAQDIAPYLLFSDPTPNFEPEMKLVQMINGMDNANVNLFKMADDLVAVADFPRVYTIEESSLRTMDQINPAVEGQPDASNRRLSTSHPVPEYGTKNWLNIITDMGVEGGSMHVVRCKGASIRERITTIKFDYLPYLHSFGATEKHLILFLNPVHMDILKFMNTGEPVQALTYEEGKPTYVHVVEIATGKVQVLETEGTFGLHYANSFVMSDNTIVVDAVTYPDIDNIKMQLLKLLLDPVGRNSIPTEKAVLKRYLINLEKGTVQSQGFPVNPAVPGAGKLDFPVFNELYRYRSYCYIWGVTLKLDGVHQAKWALSKKDLCDSTNDKMWYQENHYPGEPWFIPRPGAEKEDDGHLIVVMLDGEKQRSYLAFFDAHTLEMVNKAYLPTHLPMTLHGRFIPHM